MGKLAPAIFVIIGLSSCTVVRVDRAEHLEENARLVAEVKAFGKTLGIEPTEALSRTAEERPPLSMLWLWMQRVGTLALEAPIDIRMAIGFAIIKEQLKLEQVYSVDGYSVYYRQGNEFADSRSVATAGFASEEIAQRVKVILHEDLHDDQNFNLPWEVEEAIVTPLGSLAAMEFFRRSGDQESFQRARTTVEEERRQAQELNALVEEAQRLFKTFAVEKAQAEILSLIPSYPAYQRQFERQVEGQHPPSVLEAKLSHDLAYYRYFDQIIALADKATDLKTLIDDLKKLPSDPRGVQAYLQQLKNRYSRSTN
ncbi:MAG TPA: hypothetical protein VJ864_15545 [Candidatus Binatia bacterium]|nr:hypothetical protein [Candidatus Binatia bacterium]